MRSLRSGGKLVVEGGERFCFRFWGTADMARHAAGRVTVANDPKATSAIYQYSLLRRAGG